MYGEDFLNFVLELIDRGGFTAGFVLGAIIFIWIMSAANRRIIKDMSLVYRNNQELNKEQATLIEKFKQRVDILHKTYFDGEPLPNAENLKTKRLPVKTDNDTYGEDDE